MKRNSKEEKAYFEDCRCHHGIRRMLVLSAVCFNHRQWVSVTDKLGSVMRNAQVIEFIYMSLEHVAYWIPKNQ